MSGNKYCVCRFEVAQGGILASLPQLSYLACLTLTFAKKTHFPFLCTALSGRVLVASPFSEIACRLLTGTLFVTKRLAFQTTTEKSPGAYFLPEFALSPQGSFLEDTTGEQFLTYRYDDQVRTL